MQISSS